MADRDELHPRPLGLLIVSALFAAFTLYAALRVGDVMASFRDILDLRGASIPPLTGFVLKMAHFWWIIALPAFLVFAWVARRREVTRTQKSRMKLAVVGVIVFGAAVYGLVAYALYSPLWAMDKTI